ncbi:glycoside hydrolase family 3 protein [Bdellovibrio sp. ZAP7]|uniref:glycoside hydrolase family 3 protein n=1 Tax=Bdellovibrio sp. ZAP7 TaxID=2231053 RepID=UPI00115B58D8|nr:glycoside hydrolase family 3 N-terminal domain-containing protein [Bdellovibrio sp. ZAP7]QDK47273.1 glycoside hydrolase family 3 protein [Bdellovibrio sp. ZAP7]
MNKYIREIFRILSNTLLFFAFPALVLAQSNPAPSKSLDEIIDLKISKMSLQEKVGQLFIVGFPYTKTNKDLEKFIGDYKPGAFLLFKRNIVSLEQVKKLNEDLYKISYQSTKLPPLIAIDQEGGAVSRLPIQPSPPNALAIGQTQSTELSEEMGYQTGLFLREVGFNMNLAPVLDIADPYSTSFIGVRSFGSDPNLVKEIGTAYAKGLLRSKVIPTAKHFPGTGNIKADPHSTIVNNAASENDLKKKDLVPFEGYSSLGTNVAVMLSHSIYPALDPKRLPASFSSKISTELLRNDLKYKGLVVTDDLQMKGSKEVLRTDLAALKALLAGADIVMMTWSVPDQERAMKTVKTAVEDGRFPIDSLNQKLHRILVTKAFANIYRRDPNLPSLIAGDTLSSQDYVELEDKVLTENIKTNLLTKSLPEARANARTPAAATGKVCAYSPSKEFLDSFKSASQEKVITKQLFGTSKVTDVTAVNKSSRCNVILMAVTGPKTARLLKMLPVEIKKSAVVVNLGSPGLVPKEHGYRKLIQLYFNHKDSGKKVAEHFLEILSSESENFAWNP